MPPPVPGTNSHTRLVLEYLPLNSRTLLNAHRFPFESVMGQARDASPQSLGSAPCPSPRTSDEQVRPGLPPWEVPQAKTVLGSGPQSPLFPRPPIMEAAGEHRHPL